ncbi:MAG TPA: secretion protein [Alphaproteobacteria bacterium]|jgi:outer membrane protein|nr:secretion protein [Alphaproteobacteria bacterium]
MSAFSLRIVVFASALFSALSILCASGHAQTSNPYKEALATAYRSNPQLQAERARQRSTDEGVARALGGFRPTVTVIGEAGRAVDEFRTRNSFTGATNITDVNRGPRTVQLLGRQPIYDGGQAISDYRRSEAIVEQGRARLISVEQSVLQDAAQAYVDVARDYKVVQLTRDNVDYLTELKTAIEARFTVRDVTNTDVAQAEARLARGLADYQAAQGALARSYSAYKRVIGEEAIANPDMPPIPEILPDTMETALAEAENNPTLRAAIHAEQAARAQIGVVKSGLLPDLSLRGAVRRQDDADQKHFERDTAEVLLQLSIPIYEGGVSAAQTREAKHIASQRQLEAQQASRAATDAVRAAWESLISARARIVSIQENVTAARQALTGVSEEVKVGARTVLDRLNAQQEVLDADVALLRAQRDEFLASLDLLGAVGRLTAKELALPVEIYDPVANYAATRGRWFGTGVNPIENVTQIEK